MGFPRLSSLMVGVLIVGVFVVGLSMYWTNLAVEYGVSVDDAEFSKFNSSIEKIKSLSEEINRSYKGMEGIQAVGAFDKLSDMASNFWSTIKLMFGSVSLLKGMIDSSIGLLVAGEVGAMLRVALIGMLIISLTFIAIYLIFKVKI